MGKVKSAIITSLIVIVIAVLAFFSLFSWTVPGSGGIDRYNSFVSSIRLGGELTGYASTVLYPKGVISAEEYEISKPTDAEKLEEYEKKYEKHGNYYFDKDAVETGEEEIKASVKSDAAILNKRYAQKGYSAYSVSVRDEYTIRVSIPTNFSYAAYTEHDSASRSSASTAISRTMLLFSYDGALTLRNSEVGTAKYDNILTPINVEMSTYIKGASAYSVGGNHAVRVNLTGEGQTVFKTITANIVQNASNDKAIGFYIGDNQLLSLNISEVIDSSSFMITVSAEYAQDYAIILDSAVHGDLLELNYTDTPEVVYNSPNLGSLAAPMLGVALLLIIAAVIVYSIVKYKKLGLVNSLMVITFALALVTALLLLNICVTVTSAFFGVLGLALFTLSNFITFEGIRKETKAGRVVQASVKAGYKKNLALILELHAVVLAVSILLSFVAIGELASCGLMLLISTVASYVLYWFTRLMWYITSAPVKDKFAFCGYVREER